MATVTPNPIGGCAVPTTWIWVGWVIANSPWR
jgi:hypothetical protein